MWPKSDDDIILFLQWDGIMLFVLVKYIVECITIAAFYVGSWNAKVGLLDLPQWG